MGSGRQERRGFSRGTVVLLTALLGVGSITSLMLSLPIVGVVMAAGAVGIPILWSLSKPEE